MLFFYFFVCAIFWGLICMCTNMISRHALVCCWRFSVTLSLFLRIFIYVSILLFSLFRGLSLRDDLISLVLIVTQLPSNGWGLGHHVPIVLLAVFEFSLHAFLYRMAPLAQLFTVLLLLTVYVIFELYRGGKAHAWSFCHGLGFANFVMSNERRHEILAHCYVQTSRNVVVHPTTPTSMTHGKHSSGHVSAHTCCFENILLSLTQDFHKHADAVWNPMFHFQMRHVVYPLLFF